MEANGHAGAFGGSVTETVVVQADVCLHLLVQRTTAAEPAYIKPLSRAYAILLHALQHGNIAKVLLAREVSCVEADYSWRLDRHTGQKGVVNLDTATASIVEDLELDAVRCGNVVKVLLVICVDGLVVCMFAWAIQPRWLIKMDSSGLP